MISIFNNVFVIIFSGEDLCDPVIFGSRYYGVIIDNCLSGLYKPFIKPL